MAIELSVPCELRLTISIADESDLKSQSRLIQLVVATIKSVEIIMALSKQRQKQNIESFDPSSIVKVLIMVCVFSFS